MKTFKQLLEDIEITDNTGKELIVLIKGIH